ncbi:hypothetical protein M409DRAFT_51960 [Zasmidium cellare ATCC 36951]|uniref:Uncharacterized protein n=1 Tax=Zasmidium cellare ATCC 36951 TaxID=1080233 RepID=A0A6A6CVJ4_ZASCE|nr:uncharacterized protein M409DRAFT_51960 [Zasmidium cellare ATCC 36951]KAF2170218.1 hypothetical protein M409DRAFT_51960 [Zasmidium cellare ATCC 36951]
MQRATSTANGWHAFLVRGDRVGKQLLPVSHYSLAFSFIHLQATTMGQSELTTISAYGRDSSTSSVFSTANEKGNNVRARAPYRIRHRGWFIAIISTIFVTSIGHLAMGILIASVVNPHAVYYDDAVQETYSSGTLISRVALVFFWVTIPAVMSTLSLVELIQISRNRMPEKWIVISAVAATLIWAVQMTLEGICMWGLPNPVTLSRGGMCLWRYSTNPGWTGWYSANVLAWIVAWLVIPVLCMYIIYFSVGLRAVVVDKRDLKAQSAPEAPKADSLSLHTLSTSPVAETLVTDTLHASTRGVTRPPSYFSSSAASFDSYDVKKD